MSKKDSLVSKDLSEESNSNISEYESSGESSSECSGDRSMDISYEELYSQEERFCESLMRDIEIYKTANGDDSVIVKNKVLDIIEIVILFSVNNISKNVSQAWGIDKSKKLCMSFETTGMSFILDCPKNIRIFQYSTSPENGDLREVKVGVNSQLAFIVQKFLSMYYRRNNPENLIMIDKLVGLGFKLEDILYEYCNCDQKENMELIIEHLIEKDVQRSSLPPSTIITDRKKHRQEIEDMTLHYWISEASKHGNFMISIMKYIQHRIPTLHEHCVICDQEHLFEYRLLKPAVCRRDLCIFTLQQFNILSDAEVATQGEVIDLLVAMAKSAANSTRSSAILSPYPSIFDPNDSSVMILNPEVPNYELAKKYINNISIPGTINCKDMNKEKMIEYAVLQWMINSNRTHLAKLPKEYHIKSMSTDYQYMMLSATPEKEEAFQRLKKIHGSSYAFHGSRGENWHSILRNGLKNASGTSLQLNGAAYGSGIYLSTISSTSFSYSMMGCYNPQIANQTPKEDDGLLLQSGNWGCLALCEVAQVTSLKKSGSIWVAPDEDSVITRFFFVYKSMINNVYFDTQNQTHINEINEAISYC